MALTDILIVGTLVVFLIALLRASETLGKNPHRQIKAHEDLGVSLPPNMSHDERLRLINLYGVSSSSRSRAWLLVLAVVGLLVAMLWFHSPLP
jgi:hypothetical protein